MNIIKGRRPTVAEYYNNHIDNSVDLIEARWQCCPFHSEKTPSFVYNPEKDTWCCYGKCHARGNAIDMHQRVFHLSSREEAERSLDSLYEVSRVVDLRRLNTDILLISEDKVEDESTYAEACLLANSVDRWLELDYVLSKVPFERYNLIDLLNKWKGIKSVLD